MHAQPVVVYYCRTYTKAVRGGGSEEGRRVLWDATSRGLCARVGPSSGTKKKLKQICFQRLQPATNGGPSVGGRGDPEEVPTEARKQGGEWGKTELLSHYLFPFLSPGWGRILASVGILLSMGMAFRSEARSTTPLQCSIQA